LLCPIRDNWLEDLGREIGIHKGSKIIIEN
jgi:hypothetical protein